MFRISTGKLFHDLGAAAVNNLPPNVAKIYPWIVQVHFYGW